MCLSLAVQSLNGLCKKLAFPVNKDLLLLLLFQGSSFHIWFSLGSGLQHVVPQAVGIAGLDGLSTTA